MSSQVAHTQKLGQIYLGASADVAIGQHKSSHFILKLTQPSPPMPLCTEFHVMCFMLLCSNITCSILS